MAKSMAQLIVERAKRDPKFKKQVIDALKKNLKALQRAITAVEKLK